MEMKTKKAPKPSK